MENQQTEILKKRAFRTGEYVGHAGDCENLRKQHAAPRGGARAKWEDAERREASEYNRTSDAMELNTANIFTRGRFSTSNERTREK